jgi:hypothetical protein
LSSLGESGIDNEPENGQPSASELSHLPNVAVQLEASASNPAFWIKLRELG